MVLKRKHEEDLKNQSPHKKHKHDSDFSIIHASTVVSIPPVFTSNPKEGVLEMLDSMIMRYIPPLEGVVLTHSNLRFLQSTALLQYDCPYAKCNVSFDATVWSPRSEKFEWGPAENDPEFGAGAENLSIEKTDGEDTTMANGEYPPVGNADANNENEAEADVAEGENLGSWVDEETGKPLGPNLEFTVIGLTIANQMLSLIGSFQPDPFSPRHVPPAAVSEKEAEHKKGQDSSSEAEEAEDMENVEDVINPQLGDEDGSNDERDVGVARAKPALKQTVKQKEQGKEKEKKEEEVSVKSKTKKVKTKGEKEENYDAKRKPKEKNKHKSSEFVNDSGSDESPVKQQPSAKRKIVDNANTKPKKKAKT
ncbi:hypothetical protein Clacol_000754 [Clathrus columnatus]|uniref:RPA43 OB domain-containing protein n=1 Tax=Clathrus columnatus TaxID=1419009 RepID=A0AAV5A1U5_9AGAM|nr:hypothetical protein Clacol_000754 [Clathrus columnatus]